MSAIERAEVIQRLKEDARTYGYKKNVNPYVTLLEEVKWRAGHTDYLRTRIGDLPEEQLFYLDANYKLQEHPLLTRYDKERTLLDRACKMAIDAGIAERYIELAELQGRTLSRVLDLTFSDPRLGLSDEQRTALGPALQDALKVIEDELKAQKEATT